MECSKRRLTEVEQRRSNSDLKPNFCEKRCPFINIFHGSSKDELTNNSIPSQINQWGLHHSHKFCWKFAVVTHVAIYLQPTFFFKKVINSPSIFHYYINMHTSHLELLNFWNAKIPYSWPPNQHACRVLICSNVNCFMI